MKSFRTCGVSLLLSAACLPPPASVRAPADGRLPLAELQTRFESLSREHGWIREIVYAYPRDGRSIVAWRTPRAGPALWILAGIHGEEPAGPNAAARSIASLAALADAGVSMVLVPVCNPKGYANNWRYPNTAERDWRKGGYSVGDAESLLPDLEKGKAARAAKAPGPETQALTGYALRLSETYPPVLVLDLHEDELSTEGGYIYSQGRASKGNPVGTEVARLLQTAGVPLRHSGRTRFNEPIQGGVVSQDDKGLPLRDGSIDELLAAPFVFKGGKRVPGPAAETVIVVETPAFSGSDLERRVQAQAAVLERLPELWRLRPSASAGP